LEGFVIENDSERLSRQHTRLDLFHPVGWRVQPPFLFPSVRSTTGIALMPAKSKTAQPRFPMSEA
jgi:hypothetical protein